MVKKRSPNKGKNRKTVTNARLGTIIHCAIEFGNVSLVENLQSHESLQGDLHILQRDMD